MHILKEFPNYAITTDGEIYSKYNRTVYTKRIKPVLDSGTGYFLVTLYREDGKRKNQFIHRLLALVWLPNPENKPQVNHIDGNKQNNNLDNLEWVTAAENTQHAVATGLSNFDYCKLAVHQCCKQSDEILNTFESGREAHRITGIAFQNISKVLNNKRITAGGYKWKYAT